MVITIPRYIDANRLWHEILIQCNKEVTKYKTMRRALGNVGRVALDCVETAPTVDAVEVVRCRDCKHWGTGYGGETEHVKVCEFANYMVGANGYCVYGERKDAEVEG